MIFRQLCVRQSRQFFALNRARIFNRFNSTIEPPVQAAVQTPSEIPSFKGEVSSREDVDTQRGGALQPAGSGDVLETWGMKQAQKHRFHGLGSVLKDTYDPEDIIRRPPRPSDITLELLLASQTHLGHSTSRWNPQNSRYIFGIREKIHIISLDVTAAYLRRAAKVVEEVAARGGLILFVGTRPGQKRSVVRAAELARGYHVFERWIPGSLTNGQQILGHCQTKVVNAFDEELPEYQENLSGRAVVKPDLVVCFNPIENVVLLHECGLNNVPTIGIIDTDADPTRVTYPIPANDDSLRSVGIIAGILGRAGEAGQKRRVQLAEKGVLPYQPVTARDLKSDPFIGSQQ